MLNSAWAAHRLIRSPMTDMVSRHLGRVVAHEQQADVLSMARGRGLLESGIVPLALPGAGQAAAPVCVSPAPLIPGAGENNVQVTKAATAIDASSPLDAKRIALNNFATATSVSSEPPLPIVVTSPSFNQSS